MSSGGSRRTGFERRHAWRAERGEAARIFDARLPEPIAAAPDGARRTTSVRLHRAASNLTIRRPTKNLIRFQ